MRLDWSALLEVLRGCSKVVLTSHVRPDCDALGSELGMAGILQAIGKDVRIVNAQATPANLKWIDPRGMIESLAEKVRPADLADRDLFIVLDTSAWAQLGAMGDVAKSMRDRVLVIDHHVSEDDLSDRWFKDTAAEATARIVYEIGLRLRVPLIEAIATPLYAGLSTDTGGFRFPSVSGESFRIAGRLDCNALAARFGGGGHKAAAGTIIDGPFDAAHEQVVAAVDDAWLTLPAVPA